MTCIFCQIISGEAPAEIVFRDEQVTAFADAHPAASVHLLIVPNRHIASLNDLAAEDELLAGHLLAVARRLAAEQSLVDGGYRLVINTGAGSGQTVPHLHLHLLGGGKMRTHLG